MDADRFDDIARSLTSQATRRTALGITIGGVSAALGFADASTKKRKKKKKCKGKKKKCGKKCIPRSSCCTDAYCPSGWFCSAGSCLSGAGTCPTGQQDCSGFAVCGGADTCLCLPTARGTRCAAFGISSDCGNCNSDPDCVALGYGKDAFCIVEDCFCTPGVGLCFTPCARCIGNDDCPAGCHCAETAEASVDDTCVVSTGGCGGICSDNDECDPRDRCVNIPECGGFTCRRRCGA